MVAVDRGVGTEQSFVHLYALAHLNGSNGSGSDGLIEITQPGNAGRSAAGAALGDAIGLQRAGGIENCFVDIAHGVDGIHRRFVVMLGVEAHRDAVNVVELVTVEIPVFDKFFGEVFIVFANFGNGGAKRGEIARHLGRFAVFIENQPARMFLDDFRDAVGVRFVARSAVFDGQRQPPQLNLDSLLVELLDHVLDGVSGKGIAARLPVAVIVEPTIVESRPVNSEVLQLRNGAEHLRRGDIGQIAPAAPTHRVVFRVRGAFLQTFGVNHVRIHAEWFVIVAGIYGDESLRRGVRFARLERGIGSEVHTGKDAAVWLRLHGNG